MPEYEVTARATYDQTFLVSAPNEDAARDRVFSGLYLSSDAWDWQVIDVDQVSDYD